MHYPVLVFIFKPPENEALVFEPWIIFPGDVFISLWFYSPPNSSEPFHKKGDKKEKESYQVVRFLVYSVYMPLNLHKSNHVPLSFPNVP